MTATIRQVRLLCQSLFPPILDIVSPIPGPRVIAAAARLLGVVPVQRCGPHAALQDGHRERRGDATPAEPATAAAAAAAGGRRASAGPLSPSQPNPDPSGEPAAVLELQPEAELVPELQHLQPDARRAPGEDAAPADADGAAAVVRLPLGEEDADDAGVADDGGRRRHDGAAAHEQAQEDEGGDGGGRGPLRGADGLHQADQEESRPRRRPRVKFSFFE